MSVKLVQVVTKADNVALALKVIQKGTKVDIGERVIIVKEEIPFGHKVAITHIGKGQPVTKYGETIGNAVQEIAEGCHVHIHNLKGLRGEK